MLTSSLASIALVLALQAQPEADQEKDSVETTEIEATAEAEAADDDNEIICRRTATIGSKFKKRICATKREWETLTRRASSTTGEMQRRGKGVDPVN